MSSRLLPIFLIVAILACPLTCSAGLCCGGVNGQSEANGDQQADPDLSQPLCCCNQPSNGSEQLPSEPRSDKSACQGICGGAIFEKSSEVHGLEWLSVLPEFQNEVSLIRLSRVCLSDTQDLTGRCKPRNQGRFVRTLTMSFLC